MVQFFAIITQMVSFVFSLKKNITNILNQMQESLYKKWAYKVSYEEIFW